MAREVSEEEIARMRELYAQCGNYSLVAQIVGRSAVTVARCIKRDKEKAKKQNRS